MYHTIIKKVSGGLCAFFIAPLHLLVRRVNFKDLLKEEYNCSSSYRIYKKVEFLISTEGMNIRC
jgi:hypothetical protein